MRRDGQAGFTLIEISIVLIIIGLLVGAVLKGQDIIDNARSKRFTTYIRQGEIAQWVYYDRQGVFAGDEGNRNGLLGDHDKDGDPVEMLAKNQESFRRSLSIGSSGFFMRYGNWQGRPVIIMSKSESGDPGLGASFGPAETNWAGSFDVLIDGDSNATKGLVRGYGETAFDKAGKVWNVKRDAKPLDWTAAGEVKALVYAYSGN